MVPWARRTTRHFGCNALGFCYWADRWHHVRALGAGDLRPEAAGTEVSADVRFPEAYSISYVAVYKLVKRTLEVSESTKFLAAVSSLPLPHAGVFP